MKPAEYEKLLYQRRVAEGQRKVVLWIEGESLAILKLAAKKDRRSVTALIAVILEDWVKYHVEDEANP